jgi:MoaA/NifB/PqqE/SkfB family radical SAM enzyme
MSKFRKFITKWFKRARMLTRLILFKLGLDNRPVFAVLTVNANCNFRCKYCFADYHSRHEQALPTDAILRIINELDANGVIYLNVHGGEALIRNDMGQILRHALGKGMFVNLITNGTLLQKRWEDVKDVDSFCISLDGRPENNDKNRGAGSFKVASEAIDFALSQGVPVRIGMTVTKHTMGDLEWIAEWAMERRIYIHHYLLFDQENLPEELRMTREENRQVLRELIGLRKRKYPIFYSLSTLEYALNWPYEKEILRRPDLDGLALDPNFKMVPCQYKNINMLIESNGTVRVCNATVRQGAHISVLDRPLKEAKEELLRIDDCLYCYHLPKMEFSHLINLRFESVMNQFVNQLVEDVKALLFKKKKGA